MARIVVLFLFAYPPGVSSTCRVLFTDGADVTHTATVCASSLYEAAALGIAEFKRNGFAFTRAEAGAGVGLAFRPWCSVVGGRQVVAHPERTLCDLGDQRKVGKSGRFSFPPFPSWLEALFRTARSRQGHNQRRGHAPLVAGGANPLTARTVLKYLAGREKETRAQSSWERQQATGLCANHDSI